MIKHMWHAEMFYGVEDTLPTDDITFLYPFILGHKGQTFYDCCRIFLIPCQNGTEVKS